MFAIAIRGLRAGLTAAAAGALLTACAQEAPRNPVPEDLVELASIPGFPENVRAWGDVAPEGFGAELRKMGEQLRAHDPELWAVHGGEPVQLLAISGGAEDGAFGAGILNGWTARGDRPQFEFVTGVSTGSLTAPFAFLGPKYDDVLKEVYTSITADDVFTQRTLGEILGGASVLDTSPLRQTVSSHVTDEFLAEVAAEHEHGRRLLVMTVHLDAQRPMIWNMGEIAKVGGPEARELFVDVLMASSSPPAFFPPIAIEVEVNGEIYDELHADGGVVAQQTALGPWTLTAGGALDEVSSRRSGEIYVIRNGLITPEWEETSTNNLKIGRRTISTMIKYFAAAAISFEYYVTSLRDNLDFRMTWISEDFEAEQPEPFDPGYMQELYQYGFDRITKGEPWAALPPYLIERRSGQRIN